MTPGAFGPLSVGLVHPFSWPDVRRGGERYLEDLATYLTGRGHAVDIVTGTDGGGHTETRADGITVRRVPYVQPERLAHRGVSKVDAFGLAALPRLLRRRYDVVHTLVPSAALATRFARARTVLTLLGHPTQDQLGARRFDERLFREAVARATVCVALSQASRASAQQVFGQPIGVLPPGVRLEQFPVKSGPATAPRILFPAAADEPRKRLDLVLEAFGLLLDRRPDARLVLGGPGDPTWALEKLGPNRAAVEASVDQLGAGALSDVPERYRAASVTVLPSRNEAFGLVLVESLSSGTPVVCTDEGGMPEIVDRPEIGRVAPCDDAAALCVALDEAIALSLEPGTAGRCAAHAQRWGWEAVGAQHEHVYRMAVAGRAAEVVVDA